MSEKAIVIYTDGSKDVAEFEKGDSYNLLSSTVGGLIQCVSLDDKEGKPDMWLNEEGKLIGLDQNPTATALWVDMYGTTDVIMGNVIITGGCDEEGETIGLTDEQLAFFLAYDSAIWHTNAPGFVSLS